MDKRLTRFTSPEAMKRAERDAWRKVSPTDRIRAVTEIAMALYAMKGSMPDVPRLQRTLVRIQRASREDLLAAKLAAGRPQDLADASALTEHLETAEQKTDEAAIDLRESDRETASKRAVVEWLTYRAQVEAEQAKGSGKDAAEDLDP